MDTNRIMSHLDNLSSEELEIAKSIMTQLMTTGESDILAKIYKDDYNEIPVSIDEFLENPEYLGKVFNNGASIYPFWRDTLRMIFHDNPDHAHEIAFTGAIGLGKSTIAAIAMMYQMYRVLCLKDPQKYYHLTNNAPIVFVCLNLTLDLAYSGLYAMIVSALQMSPWFMSKCDVRGKYSYTISFPKNIELLCASTVQHVIGKNVLMALMDEINFSNAPKGSQRSVLDMYRNLKRRIESRFMSEGIVKGYIFLISSKNTEQDFLDTYIQSLKGSKSIIVIDKPVWEVKPANTYSGERFKVAVGDKTKDSYILKDGDDPQEAIDKGYYIIEPPIEYKTAFEQDINDALKDIAGISAVSTSKLIPYAGRIELCFNEKKRSPFFSEEIQLGLDSVEDIKDFLDDLSILKKDLEKIRFAHVDIGLKGDRLGITVVHRSKSVTVEKYTASGAIDKVSENIYEVDLMLGIRAIPGSEIPLFKVREFFLWLRTSIGYNFGKITFDGFQSADSMQLLKIAGFNTELLSVDRTDIPYINLRSCILDQRLDSYYNSIVIEELRDLEYDRKAKKVDHPLTKVDGTPGSKDISDSLCLSYDTRLFLLSGKSMTIEELYDSELDNEWVLACDIDNEQLMPVRIARTIRKSHIPDRLLKITLDNGKSFKVTRDHLILMRDNTYSKAEDLSVNDSLMPFTVYDDSVYKGYEYRKTVNPYNQCHEFIYHIVRDTILKEEFNAVDLSLDGGAYKVIHHADMNKMNDNPDNLKPISNKAHRKLHGEIFTKYNKSEKHAKDILDSSRKNMEKIWSTPEIVEKIKAAGRRTLTEYNQSQAHRDRVSELWASGHYDHTLANLVKRGNTPEAKAKMIETKRANGTLEKYSKSMTESNKNAVLNHKRQISKVRKHYELVLSHSHIFDSPVVTREMYLSEIDRLRSGGIIPSQSRSSSKYEDLIEAGVPISNHRVIAIEEIDNEGHYVYDLMLDSIHNFAIDAGVFVHNCGAVYDAQEYYSKKKGNKLAQSTQVSAAISAVQRIKNIRDLQKTKELEDNWIL